MDALATPLAISCQPGVRPLSKGIAAPSPPPSAARKGNCASFGNSAFALGQLPNTSPATAAMGCFSAPCSKAESILAVNSGATVFSKACCALYAAHEARLPEIKPPAPATIASDIPVSPAPGIRAPIPAPTLAPVGKAAMNAAPGATLAAACSLIVPRTPGAF